MNIAGRVVVITGASSGIGRATALALAARGARLVLIARDVESLDRAAAECAARGAEAEVVAVDVTDAGAVEAAARRAVDRFGRIDAWVNAASVMMFGAFVDVPLDDLRRVLDVNLMGYVHGCRAALPRMIERGRGVVVNVSSLLGVVALPYGSSYTMAKFAVRGLGGSLRQELRLSGARGVSVCTVLPGPVDTPIFRHAANHSGRRARALPPVYTPERVARIVVNLIRVPRPEVIAGGLLCRAFHLQHKVLPGSAERVLAMEVDRWCLSRTETAPAGTGNLYRPAPGPGQVTGGWQGRRRERRRRALTVLAAVGTAALLGRYRRR
jgi:NAD(P)-dependent dehydrogenase (short-subunit alcohol dehydrogenase family)